MQSARTYFYLNEATCERNMETFLKCLEAVSGNLMDDGVAFRESIAYWLVDVEGGWLGWD